MRYKYVSTYWYVGEVLNHAENPPPFSPTKSGSCCERGKFRSEPSGQRVDDKYAGSQALYGYAPSRPLRKRYKSNDEEELDAHNDLNDVHPMKFVVTNQMVIAREYASQSAMMSSMGSGNSFATANGDETGSERVNISVGDENAGGMAGCTETTHPGPVQEPGKVSNATTATITVAEVMALLTGGRVDRYVLSLFQKAAAPREETNPVEETWCERLTRKCDKELPLYKTVFSLRMVESQIMCSAIGMLSEALPRGDGDFFSLRVFSSLLEAFNGIRLSKSPGEKKDVFSTATGTIQFRFGRKSTIIS